MWHPGLGEGSGQLRPCHLQCGQRAELRAEALQRRELRDLGRDAHRLLTERLGVGLAEQLTGERTQRLGIGLTERHTDWMAERLGVGVAEQLTGERTERLPAGLP